MDGVSSSFPSGVETLSTDKQSVADLGTEVPVELNLQTCEQLQRGYRAFPKLYPTRPCAGRATLTKEGEGGCGGGGEEKRREEK